MLRGVTRFKCDVYGHTLRAMDFEWQATVYTMPVPCPNCGSRHTMPVSFFGCTNRETYKKIWEMNDTLIDSATRRGIWIGEFCIIGSPYRTGRYILDDANKSKNVIVSNKHIIQHRSACRLFRVTQLYKLWNYRGCRDRYSGPLFRVDEPVPMILNNRNNFTNTINDRKEVYKKWETID